MRIPLYQVDAFARRPFEGNPAAVCPLDRWLEDDLLQAIAAENNLSETAFFVRESASTDEGTDAGAEGAGPGHANAGVVSEPHVAASSAQKRSIGIDA